MTVAEQAALPSRRSRALGRLRLVLLYALLAALAWASRPTPASVVAGLPLVLLGEAIRLWAAGHLLKSRELTTSGPYAHTQNPLYLGRILIYAGFCVMARLPYGANLAVLAAGAGVFFLYYIPRKIRVEGARLARIHGAAWEAYHRSMPVLVPRWRRYEASVPGPWRLERMLRNREHLMLLGVALLCALFAARAW